MAPATLEGGRGGGVGEEGRRVLAPLSPWFGVGGGEEEHEVTETVEESGYETEEKVENKEKKKQQKKRKRMTRRGLRKKSSKCQKTSEGLVRCRILLSNIRGAPSKQESFESILNDNNIDVGLVNETNLHGRRKIKYKNYSSFTKNHPTKKSMGGISTSVADYLKGSAIKVSENSEVDEYLVVRLEHVEPPLNIINIYGQQEDKDGQDGRDRILESWGRIKKELCEIELRGEAVLIMGDLNRALGSDELGIPGNKARVSHGGALVRGLLEDGEYFLLNSLDLAVGGPWTRVDPSSGVLSCLDIAIGSANLLPYVHSFQVDSDRKFTPNRIHYKDGKYGVTFTDHFSVLAELQMPGSEVEQKKESKWNVYKPGAWNNYEWISNLFAKKMEEIIDDNNLEIEEVMAKVDKLMEKIKHKCFGKTKPKTRSKKEQTKHQSTDENEVRLRMEEQSKKLEAEISKIIDGSQSRSGRLYKMKEIIEGPKKSGLEPQAIKDPKTEQVVVTSSEIKKVTLDYCLETLTNNEPEDDDVKDLVRIKEEVLKTLMENSKDGSFKVTEEDFWIVVNKFERKKKQSYNFLVKAGNFFKRAICKLCMRILNNEEIPKRFFDTLLVQLYKGVGCFRDPSNSRFLHMKDFLPRVCEALVVEDMREGILESSTKFQIGGQPRMRTQFHLFVIKSIMGIKERINNGAIFTFRDLRKFFDKESLVDGCLALNGVVDPRALRLWWLLNSQCNIRVRTGVGMTECGEAGGTMAQGSSRAGLVSQRLLDKELDTYFSTSRDEFVYGGVRLQPIAFLDDIERTAGSVDETRAGNAKLASMLSDLCLEAHPDKSCYLVCGSTQFKEQVEKETKDDPIMLGKLPLKRKAEVKYLGDVISEGGPARSVEATIAARVGKARGAVLALKALCEDFRMDVVGGMQGAIDLFNACIVSSLLSNCSTWTEISKESIKQLDAIQNEFVKLLLHLPSSTPVTGLRTICGLLGMEWKIWQEKLILVQAIRLQEEGGLAKELFQEQVNRGWPGLAQEATLICETIGLKNVCTESVDKKEIKEAIILHHMVRMKEEMGGEKLKELRMMDLRKPQAWLSTLCMAEARMAARLQLSMLRCPGSMPGLFRGRMECVACAPWRQEGEAAPVCSQVHLQQDCKAYSFLRQHFSGVEFEEMRSPSKILVKFFMELMWIRS